MSNGLRSAIGLAVLMAACAAPPPSREPVTAPPAGPSPAIASVVRDDDLEVPPTLAGDRLEAIAASDVGFVAVGVRDRHGLDDAMIWFSEDGLRWESVGDERLLAGGSLVDVAAGPEGFVAVGTDRVRDVDPDGLILVSRDGRQWRRADAGVSFAYVMWVAAGADGWLAGGAEADTEPVGLIWRSDDAVGWQRHFSSDVLGPNASFEVAPDGDRWVAFGAAGEHGPLGAIWSSPDRAIWTREDVEAQAGDMVAKVVTAFAATPGARLAIGQFGSSCGLGGSCPGELRAWRSQAGEGWRLLPRDVWPFFGDVAVVASRRDLVLAHSGGIVASTDAWRWLELAAADPAGGVVRDVAVRDGTVVLVGERFAGADVFPYLAAASP